MQDTTYLVYPRINTTVCDTIHDDVGPTANGGDAAAAAAAASLSANLLAAAVSSASRVGRAAGSWCAVCAGRHRIRTADTHRKERRTNALLTPLTLHLHCHHCAITAAAALL